MRHARKELWFEAPERRAFTGRARSLPSGKRQLMAHQVVLAISDGRLDLGPWEQVFYAEFDGRRRKRVLLKAIGD